MAEVCKQCLVVQSLVYIEPVPEVSAYHSSSESHTGDTFQVVEAYASAGHHFTVYEPPAGCILQLFLAVAAFLLRRGDAVEDRVEEEIVCLTLLFCQFIQ